MAASAGRRSRSAGRGPSSARTRPTSSPVSVSRATAACVISFNISSKQSNILETGFANLFQFDNFVHTHSRKSEAALSRSIMFLIVIAFTRGLTIVLVSYYTCQI